ncbi:hypothetical protein PIB30_050509 [Stylosanthes scabra]|uniref:Uncharacterized protein n=1 Tax=Stylosanthes scabra TaxID=79078 RepID=A0ABU6SJ73_9FABA|nr:hypothetical protein [Stylosanthes scabra]
MGGAFFAPLSECACILAFDRRGACFFTPINFTLLPRKRIHVLRAYQGRKLFDSFEESIQEFKWHYFKILPLPGKRRFWLDDEGAPFLWVYWNAEVDPLEALAFEFLQSLLAGLDSLLKDMEKQRRFDLLMQKMKEAEGAGPRSILPSSKAQTTASGASASNPVAPASIPATSVPPAPSVFPGPSSSASKAARKPTNATAAKPFSVEREKGVREDPAADLRQKRRKRKASEASAEEAALGHKVNPIDRAFLPDYNFRAALDAGLTNDPIREILGPLVPEQLLGTAQFLACQLTACLQVGVDNTFAAKVQLEKELAATKEQVDVLTAERDSALAAPLLHAKIKSLTEELERAEGERLYATDRMEEVEMKANVQAAELESCRSALAQERKKVRHLNPAINYSMITLDTRWDPKTKRIYNPKAEVQGQSEPVVEQPEPVVEEQHAEEVVAGKGGGCPT